MRQQEAKLIFRRLEVGMFASNCYILGSEPAREGLIIDPGDEDKRILSVVEALGLSIKLVVLTHGHIDHIGAVAMVKEATKAEVAIHSGDASALQGDGRFLPLNGPVRYPTLSLGRLLKDGDSIDVGPLHFKVLHTPGHTPGGICLLGHDMVFTGDTLFCQSVGRSDLGGGSHKQLINSIQTRLMTLPDNIVAYPGHGPETTIGQERLSNPFLHGL